ncbi:MAG: hypothetical protein MI749_02825, partial [Desulfovibrionales bacterium]|nr:hypothetical protein [Desulfovibrionales bacterium]
HYDQEDVFRDGIQYQVVGALGGAVKQGNAAAGGWWHVTRLTIDDAGKLSWQLIPVGPGEKSDFSRRYDMDRVQSLAYALGNAAAQLGRMKLVGTQGKEPGRIRLTALGNPVDVPVDIRIRVKNTDQFILDSGAFELDHCLEPPGKFQARIRPGANIAGSNASTVKPACARYSPDFSQCLEYSPFWEGRVIPVPGRSPRAGHPLILTLEIRYRPRAGGETMVLSQDATIPLGQWPEN